jgi:hypothetical protein
MKNVAVNHAAVLQRNFISEPGNRLKDFIDNGSLSEA